MKKLSLLLFLLLILGFIGFFGLKTIKEKVQHDLAQPVAYPSVTVGPTLKVDRNENVKRSLFVPYWTLKDDVPADEYATYIYFGISPGSNGIDMTEAGADNVDAFLKAIPPGKKKILTLRMINNKNNFAVLKDVSKQKKIIDETIAFARKHEFDGVLLDLEVSAIPFDSLIQQINSFTKLFYTQTEKDKLTFSIALYGDTFYRIRPFEVKALAHNTDEIFIMAYDFHKSNGNPGPNFPLKGRSIYGYDAMKMTDDFLQFVPAKKITVIFGLFGYDWVVDKQSKATEKGQPLTYGQIKQKFLNDCLYTSCSVKRDKESSETEIRYTDEEGRDNIVWFEDMDSVTAKENYFKQRGISSFSFWANGYF
jgi:spore germination protein YaaH